MSLSEATLCCALALASGCRMYDAELVHQVVHQDPVEPIDASVVVSRVRPGVDASQEAADAQQALPSIRTQPFAAPSCGDGRVDNAEMCDVAIARGEPGACPDGCSGGFECLRRTLVGSDCTARCQQTHIEERIADDGCCPDGADSASDSDCSGVCGNGMLEAGELCDPVQSCPLEQECKSTNACFVAHYTGDSAKCSARCELQPVRACTSGDGCCPTGCDSATDTDCVPAKPQPGDEGQQCTSNCGAKTNAVRCADEHTGGSCEACDCLSCQAETLACLAFPKSFAGASCSGVIDCASAHHCTGIACYCGTASLDTCNLLPLGPCVAEIQAAAGTNQLTRIVTAASSASGMLSLAYTVVGCRESACQLACDL